MPRRSQIGEDANPLKKLRDQAGLTLETVADCVGVSKQFIIRAEQGVYTEPASSLVAFYASRLEVDVVKLEADYYEFQITTRKSHYGWLIEPWAFSLTGNHPFTDWRECSGLNSQARICVLFCVHPAIINKFEKHYHLLNEVPEQLVTALRESGYRRETVDRLRESYLAFKTAIRQGMEVITSAAE